MDDLTPAAPTASAPIGIFDSGVGGLTVARSIIDQLPGESVIYIGDTANSPYGDKPLATVRSLATSIADQLVERGCKMIVVACNSASAAFLRDARERYPVPVVEVILPAVRRAVSVTRNNRVGVIGTRATVTSGAYQDLFAASPGVEVVAQACPQFVPFIERGITSGRQLLGLAETYLEPLKEAGVDTVVLGCTHYPLLTGVIQLVMGDDVTLVSSAEETAKMVYRTLSDNDLLADPHAADGAGAAAPELTFESTGDPARFASLASRFLGPSVAGVSRIPEMLR
ncbi:MAG: glutamate racemase [Corynebacterium sp.]|uniref:glutamate racemase n=1 Tax=unclassified Corynebacterium TaxID=2624378 RepID=UPI0026490BBD|nr:glutamate racemase [Corynebacterium sp.]MDN5582042.1 glutamate racemase [Corynebacterium sp.]MDN5719395.1 glutamate racemase [Corynebacterium sp.]MDN6259070.1 glutamate racemase [Corynebacterium sp.]MDN6324112.1 glutamate racemase [Corynebacterium sp.]MDN6509394.1 glutamate racemase [Corynebacterium sp.]